MKSYSNFYVKFGDFIETCSNGLLWFMFKTIMLAKFQTQRRILIHYILQSSIPDFQASAIFLTRHKFG